MIYKVLILKKADDALACMDIDIFSFKGHYEICVYE